MNPSDAELKQRIERALERTLAQELDVLKRGRSERNFCSSFSNQISAEFPEKGLRCDPFYNKHHNAAKRLNGRTIELDIAVHERGTDERNFIAIEVETVNSPEGDDIWKVEGLTHELEGYGYQLGLFLVLGIENKAGEILEMQWYKDGHPIASN